MESNLQLRKLNELDNLKIEFSGDKIHWQGSCANVVTITHMSSGVGIETELKHTWKKENMIWFLIVHTRKWKLLLHFFTLFKKYENFLLKVISGV